MTEQYGEEKHVDGETLERAGAEQPPVSRERPSKGDLSSGALATRREGQDDPAVDTTQLLLSSP